MTITFYEYGNTIMFNKKDIAVEHTKWEEEISVGDKVLYHDSEHGTRPYGKVISISPQREYLLLRLAGYEQFVIVRKISINEYIVMKSDIAEMLESTGLLYYAGDVSLNDVFWALDPDGGEHAIFLWFHLGEHKLFTDIVTLKDYNHYHSARPEGELVDHISGRYTVSAD